MDERHIAAVCRDPRRRRTAATVHERDASSADWPASASDPAALLDAVLSALDAPLAWPAGRPARHFRLLPFATVADMADAGNCQLLCTEAWWRAVGETEMAIDLAASASPAEWLERMEDRLLESGGADAGSYAAVAWWIGPLSSEI